MSDIAKTTGKGKDTGGGKVKGPASYFPSIETAHGQPVRHWLDLIAARPDETHMQSVGWLKSEHGLGHGHANALVAHHRAKKGPAQ